MSIQQVFSSGHVNIDFEIKEIWASMILRYNSNEFKMGCSNSKKTVALPIGGEGGGTHSHDSSLHTFLARRNAVMTFLFPQRGGTTLSSLHTFTARRNRGRSFFGDESFSIAWVIVAHEGRMPECFYGTVRVITCCG